MVVVEDDVFIVEKIPGNDDDNDDDDDVDDDDVDKTDVGLMNAIFGTSSSSFSVSSIVTPSRKCNM